MANKSIFFHKDIHITVFSPGWWFYSVLTITGLCIMTKVSETMTYDQRLNMILYLSIIELIVMRIYKYLLRYVRKDYNYYNELPCYLCNQSTIMCILAAATGNSQLMSYCFTIGTLGALLAIFLPDSHNRDQLFFSLQALGFYGYHGLLIISCLGFYLTGVYEPRPADALWTTLIVLILVVIAHIINRYLRIKGLNPLANYDYTIDPELGILKKLYALNPRQFFYLLPILLAFGAVSFVILLLCVAVSRLL